MKTNWSEQDKQTLLSCIEAGVSPLKMQTDFLPQYSYDAICSAKNRELTRQRMTGYFNPSEAQGVQVESKVKKLLTGGNKHSVLDLADLCNCPPKMIREAVGVLRDEHFMSIRDDSQYLWIGEPSAGGRSTIHQDSIFMDPYLDGQKFKFGVISDNHMCSKYERLDIAEALYDVFESEGITNVFNCGNWIDGEARFNKNDLKVHGMGNQFKYFRDNYPHRERMITEFIGGDDHEGWYTQREGVDLGQMFKAYCGQDRKDLIYTSYMEHDKIIEVRDGQCVVRMLHAGGGSSYAISYTTQKLIESLTGGEKPSVMLIGHYHKSEYIYYRNIHAIQAGCFTGNTSIRMGDGSSKMIRDMRVGDEVITHLGNKKKVTRLFTKMHEGEFTLITYEENKGTGRSRQTLTATTEHPILAERNGIRYWINISELLPGDSIFVEAPTLNPYEAYDFRLHRVDVLSVEPIAQIRDMGIRVYNFEVEDDNSYIAGRVAVHNCTQDQTPFMRKKRLAAHLGGWIVELTIAPDGSVRRCKNEFINFYDRGYHQAEWKYQGD